MNKLYKQRFDAAKKLFQRLLDIPDDYKISYDGAIIHKKDIKISDKGIYIWLSDHFCETWFEYDASFDNGLYSTVEEYEKLVRDSFKVIKVLENW